MTNHLPVASRRLRILAVLCAIYGVQSLALTLRLFPSWQAAAKQGRPGSDALIWVSLASAVSALMAAVGLWRRRRWARMPFLACVLLGLGTFTLVALFAGAEAGEASAWVLLGLFAAIALAASGWLVWYVWRST